MSAWPTEAILRASADQHRLATRQQLLRAGLSKAAISRGVASGRLHREHNGVYSVGPPAQTHHELAHAAVLACGARAALSCFSSHHLWEFLGDWSAPFEVTGPSNHGRPGIITHRANLTDDEVTDHYGIPVTTPARTFLDTARRLGHELTATIDRALVSGRLKLGALEEILAHHPHHPNAKLLLPFLHREDGAARARRERYFPGQCARAGLPRPRMNADVLGKGRDAWFETEQLIVELDEYGTHTGPKPYEDDRERDTAALAHRVETVRITVDRQFRSTAKELRRLGGILAQRRAELPVLRAAGVIGPPVRATARRD